MSRKKAISSEQSANDARPRRQVRERLPSPILDELWSIWRADPRVPSLKSRRSWAMSRDANPRLVACWFTRRRTCAKRAGKPISDESYDLPLDPQIAPKQEPTATPVESVVDLPSDDTLTLVYPPYIDEVNDLEASSDTIFEDVSVELKRTETPAYKEVLQLSCTEHQGPRPGLRPSLADPDVAQYCCEELEHSSSLFCNQGQGKQSDFTCILCSARSGQDEVVSDTDTTSEAKETPFFVFPRLDFYPGTPSELSAIPFLFRTPRTVFPANAATRRLSIIEDELECLVNDRKLDFSFLDVPHLASMELLD